MTQKGNDRAVHVHPAFPEPVAGVCKINPVGGEADIVKLNFVKAPAFEFDGYGGIILPDLFRVRVRPAFIIICSDYLERRIAVGENFSDRGGITFFFLFSPCVLLVLSFFSGNIFSSKETLYLCRVLFVITK